MSETPLHDWMIPRLESLLEEARKAGFERQTTVAVIIDLVESSRFNKPAPVGG